MSRADDTGRRALRPPPVPAETGTDPYLEGVLTRVQTSLEAQEVRNRETLDCVRRLRERIDEEERGRRKRVVQVGLAIVLAAAIPTLATIWQGGRTVERIDTTAEETRRLRSTVERHDRELATQGSQIRVLWDQAPRWRRTP